MMSFTYLWAFVSLYLQLPGLYGDDGMLPVRSVLRCDEHNVVDCAFIGSKPNALHLFVMSGLNLAPFQAFETVCILGIALSSLTIIFSFARSFASYLLLWYFYFSCFQVGQTFLDTLLIETGFLTALMAPSRLFRGDRLKDVWLPIDQLTIFLVKWLGFRYIFASGIVKLNAECPTWWSLTALHYHYESQCIPTPGAWFAHQSSDWLKKLSVVATYSFEIFVALMIMIIVTGNYNFFNFLTVAICLSLLITEDLWSFNHSYSLKKRKHSFVERLLSLRQIVISLLFISGVVILPTVKLFSLRIRGLAIDSELGPVRHFGQLFAFGNALPHQPRLDWQMWFAALGSYQHNPWFISLVWKLLQNSSDVARLIDRNPFHTKPPKYIKADLFTYHFESDPKRSNWWIREKTSEYMPPISLHDKNVESYLLYFGLLVTKTKNAKDGGNAQFKTFLEIMRSSTFVDLFSRQIC
uniref:Lipase maturation factor n=1 Tax=Romanomermis culicivorax TaxID=13658 RepID=A0A915ISG8_ROMCU